MNEPLPLTGRIALVTGVSRRRGIGFAVAARLARLGASVAIHHHAAHDGDHHGEVEDVDALLSELRDHVRPGARLADVAADLAPADGARRVVDAAAASLGHLDVLVCNHAHAGDAVSLSSLTAAALDTHWTVNTRATLLLTQAFAQQHDGRRGGRVIWMTSGQGLGPMPGNLAYVASKAALAGATSSFADELAESGICSTPSIPGRSTPDTWTTLPMMSSNASLPEGSAGPRTRRGSLAGWRPTTRSGWSARC